MADSELELAPWLQWDLPMSSTSEDLTIVAIPLPRARRLAFVDTLFALGILHTLITGFGGFLRQVAH